MSFIGLLSHTISITRLTTAGAGIRKTQQAHATGVKCLIQPMNPRSEEQQGLAFGSAYTCFLPFGTDIRASDKVTDQDGRSYGVTGIRSYNFGINQHLVAMLQDDLST